ncbi:MAG: tetratricopeptide repeat protein [Acidobacteriaceae bacterium]
MPAEVEELRSKNTKPAILLALLILFFGAERGLSQNNTGSQQGYAEHIQKAQTYLREKRPDLAIPELEAAVKVDPESVDAQGNLGVLLFFQGKYAEGIPHLRVAVRKQEGLSKIQALLGLAEARTGDRTDARSDLAAALPNIHDEKFKVNAGLELVGLDTSADDLASAADVIAQLQKADPENPAVLYAAYRTYAELEARSMLTLSLVAPNSAQMHELLAYEKIKRGDTNAAIAEFHKAIAIDPDLPGVHFDLAELLKTSQDPAVKAEAEDEYRADLKQNPTDERAERRLGEIDEGFGRLNLAYKEYVKAVQMRPGDADAKLDLAKMLIQMGHEDQAMPLLKQVVELDPTIALAHLRLSQLYHRKGMFQQSEQQVKLYKKYTALKVRLTASYKELQVQPQDILVKDNEAK